MTREMGIEIVLHTFTGRGREKFIIREKITYYKFRGSVE